MMLKLGTCLLLTFLVLAPGAAATMVTVEPRGDEIYAGAFVEPLPGTTSVEVVANTTTGETDAQVHTQLKPLLP